MTTNSEIEQALTDIIPLVRGSTSVGSKDYVLEYLLGMTATEEGAGAIKRNKDLIEALKENIMEKTASERMLVHCLQILVNCTATGGISLESSSTFASLFHQPTLKALFTLVLDNKSPLADPALMLLANMSQEEENAREIQEFIGLNQEMVNVKMLVDTFCNDKYNSLCQLHHMGSLLANLTQLVKIRKELLSREDNLIPKLLPFIRYESSVDRRASTTRILRNCVFDSSCHEWLLSDDVDLLPNLLLPLAGGEEFKEEEMDKLPLDLQYLPPDKKRENDCEVVSLLLETIFMLCGTKKCRLQLKECGTYFIIRELLYIVNDDIEKAEVSPDRARLISGDVSHSQLVYDKCDMLITTLLNDEPEEGKENFFEYPDAPPTDEKGAAEPSVVIPGVNF